MSADKYESSTATNNYYPGTSGKTYTSTRFYKNSKLTFTPNTNYEITSVVFTATQESYATELANSTWTNATASASSSTATVTPTDGNTAFYAIISGTNGHTSVVVNYLETPTATLSSITLDTTNVQTTFAVNDTFTYSGLVVTAHYSDSSSAVVTPTSVSSPNMSTTGQKEVTVTYEEDDVTKTASYTITVNSNPTLNWTAPAINTYSGTSLTSTQANTWGVTYNNGSGSTTNPTYGQFSVKLGGTTISLPYTWQPGDDGKTLCVSYSSLTTNTTTVSIVQSLNLVSQHTDAYSAFEPATSISAGDTVYLVTAVSKNELAGISTTSTKYGTLASYSTTPNKVYPLTVGAGSSSGSYSFANSNGSYLYWNSGNSLNVNATLSANTSWTVEFDENGNATILSKADSTRQISYNARSGQERFATYASPAIDDTGSNNHNVQLWKQVSHAAGDTQYSNIAGHEDAQRAVVKFAKAFNTAMDTTSMCTTNMSSAWSSATSAWSTFLSEAGALGETEEAYAKSLIQYATAQWTTGTDSDYSYCLERALATYEYCVANHGQTAFMSAVRSVSVNPKINPLSLFTNKGSNTIAVITIISLVSVTAIGGYFFLRKRKEQE